MKKIKENMNVEAILAFSLAFIIVLGNFITLGSFRVFGITMTLYRVMIPVITLGLLFVALKKYKMEYFKQESKILFVFLGVMFFWIGYGAVLLFVSPYAELRAGLKELLALFLGMCSVYCIKEICDTRKSIDYFLKALRVICIFLMFFAVFEHLTNIHLETSRIYIPIGYEKTGISAFAWFKLSRIYLSSTFFYNVNDFCALLGVLLPLFFYDPQKKYKENLINAVWFFLGIFILSVNDATIVFTGVIIALVGYILLLRTHILQMVGILGATAFTNLYGTNLMVKAIKNLKKMFILRSNSASDKYLSELDGISAGVEQATTVEEALLSQIVRAQAGRGSLYTRIAMNLDSWDLFVETKGLGVGPAGFMLYFQKNGGRTYLVNPHNWWLEVLSQYGIFVFIAYVGFILYEFITLIRIYLNNKKSQYAIVIAMCLSFVVASIAPSSFLGYSYQWILPGICMCLIDKKEEYSV